MAIPDVESVRCSFLKETIGDAWKDDKAVAALAGAIAAPLLVAGQAVEGAANAIQFGQNLGFIKQLEHARYCLAMLKYLESEHALLVLRA